MIHLNSEILTRKMQETKSYSAPTMLDLYVNRVCEDRKDNEKVLVQDWLRVRPGTLLSSGA